MGFKCLKAIEPLRGGTSLKKIINKKCFAQFDTICTIQKREKHPWRNATFGKERLLACNFTKSNTPPWVFFTFLKLYKWYQIAQNITI